MRSRYSAFALGCTDYLVETLHPEHEDAKLGADAVRLSVQLTSAAMRFTGLKIVDARERDDTAMVLFVARVFEKGKDRSFVELSDFGRTERGWQYRAGTSRAVSEFPDLATLNIDEFQSKRAR